MVNSPEYDASFRLATADDRHLETYDNTKLQAINTCVTWGIVTYQMHKTMLGHGRAMALEAGAAMHEVFAWVRLCSLRNQYSDTDPAVGAALYARHGTRLFGGQRLQEIEDATLDASDLVETCKRGAIAVLDTGEFHDDPRDRRRTLNNLEECALAYIDRWRWNQPVWVRDVNDPLSDVGIEIPFDLVVDVTGMEMMSFRLTGKIDGLHWNDQRLTLHENKTASRLNDAWSMSFALSSQVTGYMIAASTFALHTVRHADILGLAIPLPRTYDYGAVTREVVSRHDYHFRRWLAWLVHTVTMYRRYANDPINAPKYTHSCSRYFRPCSLIPFCDADDTEQQVILDEMEHHEWSPLEPVED